MPGEVERVHAGRRSRSSSRSMPTWRPLRRGARAARHRRHGRGRRDLTIEGSDERVHDAGPRRPGRGGGAAPPHGTATPRSHRTLRAGRACRTSGCTAAPSSTSAITATTGRARGGARSRRAVFTDGIRIALGLGRGGRAKILPWFFIFVLSSDCHHHGIGRRGDRPDEWPRRGRNRRDFPRTATSTASPRSWCSSSPRWWRPSFSAATGAKGRSTSTWSGPSRRPTTSASRWAAFLVVTLGALWLPQLILFLGLAGGDRRSGRLRRRALGRHSALPRWRGSRWRHMR